MWHSEHKCQITDDAREYPHSSAVLFHGRDMRLKIPDLYLRPCMEPSVDIRKL